MKLVTLDLNIKIKFEFKKNRKIEKLNNLQKSCLILIANIK